MLAGRTKNVRDRLWSAKTCSLGPFLWPFTHKDKLHRHPAKVDLEEGKKGDEAGEQYYMGSK